MPCCDFWLLSRARSSANRGNPSGAARQLHPQGDGDSHAAEAAVRCAPSRGAFKMHHLLEKAFCRGSALKPPLLGEVARRSRDGGVGGLCYAALLGFSRARISANRGNPSGAARQLHPQGDGDSHLAKVAVRCAPSRGAFWGHHFLGRRIQSLPC